MWLDQNLSIGLKVVSCHSTHGYNITFKIPVLYLGNYHRIFQDGFEYNLQLAEKYGGVVKIRALFNVRLISASLGEMCYLTFFCHFQKEQLYVSDPLALYYILVKEQNIYEETDMFIM